MNSRRLAILGTRGIPARYGGFETFAEQLSVRLVERGVDVTVFCEEPENGDVPGVYHGVHLRYTKAPALGPLSTIIFDLRCLWLARKNHDVVYMLGYGAGLFCFIPRLWGSEVWINMDGIEWFRSKWNAVAKIWLRLMERASTWTADRLIADAEGIRRHLSRRYGRLPEISVIPYGADVVAEEPDSHLLEEFGLSPGCFFLVVCRLEPENHVHEILEGFMSSGATDPLVVVGDTSFGTRYVQTLLETRDSRVQFIGTVYDQEKLQALRWYCKAYFHGHSVGGTNPSLLEALGCGNLVIAHDNEFNREVAGSCALYFSSASDISDIVGRIESGPALTEHRRASQARIMEHYDWSQIADAYMDLLQ